MQTGTIKNNALETIAIEADAIKNLANFINNDFEQAVKTIVVSKGRVIVSGIGKSAIVAQKIVATLNSTGTAAVFMHAADAIHGDLGVIQPNDVVIIISKSGDSPEIKVLAPLVKNFGNILIGMVGNVNSYLAKTASIVLNTTVAKEACPNNLAPTTSTTAQMVIGDALAVCLMKEKDFKTNDFAKYHPGGALGKKLYLRAADLISTNDSPQITNTAAVKDVIIEISSKRLGATAVLNANNQLVGIITDGDIRRMLEKTTNLTNVTAQEIMTEKPITVDADLLAIEALEEMRQHNISQLIVTQQNQYLGIIHIHDMLREGLL
jgi:arabinose-5-phosphate isomerase